MKLQRKLSRQGNRQLRIGESWLLSDYIDRSTFARWRARASDYVSSFLPQLYTHSKRIPASHPPPTPFHSLFRSHCTYTSLSRCSRLLSCTLPAALLTFSLYTFLQLSLFYFSFCFVFFCFSTCASLSFSNSLSFLVTSTRESDASPTFTIFRCTFLLLCKFHTYEHVSFRTPVQIRISTLEEHLGIFYVDTTSIELR